MRVALLLLLASCSLPDEVGVSANANQFDYFASSAGGPNAWPFTNDTGYGYGVGVWASWALDKGPQVVEFEWPMAAPYYLARPGASEPSMIEVGQPAVSDSDGHLNDALAAGDRINSWSPTMQMGFWLFAIVATVAVGKLLVDRWLARRHKK